MGDGSYGSLGVAVQLDVDICARRAHTPWRCCIAVQFAFT
jgi:hypothetical protein